LGFVLRTLVARVMSALLKRLVPDERAHDSTVVNSA
jgi:Na+-transporting methylmalonyl-CoA/oxaloacetate decarboxylase gamma subunit